MFTSICSRSSSSIIRSTAAWSIGPFSPDPRVRASEGVPGRLAGRMKLSPSGMLEHARSDEGRKQLRYAGVAVVFVPLGQVLIQIIALFMKNKNGDANFTAASIIAAAILTLPN